MFLSSIFFPIRILFVLTTTNLQEQVKKAFCYQKLFWPFTVWINCSSDLKNFASNFKSFSPSLEHFFLTVGQNYFGNKIPFLICCFLKKYKKSLILITWVCEVNIALLARNWSVLTKIVCNGRTIKNICLQSMYTKKSIFNTVLYVH